MFAADYQQKVLGDVIKQHGAEKQRLVEAEEERKDANTVSGAQILVPAAGA